MKKIQVQVKKLREDAFIPEYKTEGAAGFDFKIIDFVTIKAGETKLVGTGLAMAIPVGKELQVRPRSGMSLKTKIRVSNSPGTVDSDYRGEIGIIIDNIGQADIYFEKGERIAQGVLKDVYQGDFVEVDELDETERGINGFGSTGVK